MIKRGQEGIGAFPVIIAVLILIIVGGIVIYGYLVKSREGGSILDNIKNTVWGNKTLPSLKGIDKAIKDDPKGYMKNLLDNGKYGRYIGICEKGEDPDGKLTNEEIAYLKEKGCTAGDLEKAKEELAKKLGAQKIKSETEADERYKRYRDNNDLSALQELEKDYPNSVALKFARVLKSDKFESDAEKLCRGAADIISFVYCADIYEYNANKVSNRKSEYNQKALGYYDDALRKLVTGLRDDREKRFFAYAHYFKAKLYEAVSGGSLVEYVKQYDLYKKLLDGGFLNYIEMWSKQDFDVFKQKADDGEKKAEQSVLEDTLSVNLVMKIGDKKFSSEKIEEVSKGNFKNLVMNVGDRDPRDFSRILVALGFGTKRIGHIIDIENTRCWYYFYPRDIDRFGSGVGINLRFLYPGSSEQKIISYCDRLDVDAKWNPSDEGEDQVVFTVWYRES